MCQATVYLGDEQIMSDVMDVEVVDEGVKLTSMFEPVRVVAARVREIDLMKHVVVLAPIEASEAEK